MLSFSARTFQNSVTNNLFLVLEILVWINCTVNLGNFCTEIDGCQPIHRSTESRFDILIDCHTFRHKIHVSNVLGISITDDKMYAVVILWSVLLLMVIAR